MRGMDQRDEYADRDRRGRGPSLRVLGSVLVILMAIGATVFFLTYLPPIYVRHGLR
jgi:hypothetical protein